MASDPIVEPSDTSPIWCRTPDRRWAVYGPADVLRAAAATGQTVEVKRGTSGVVKVHIKSTDGSFDIDGVEWCYGYTDMAESSSPDVQVTTQPESESASSDISKGARLSMATKKATAPEILTALARDSIDTVRRYVAKNPSTPPNTLAVLATDVDEAVRVSVAKNPHTPSLTLTHLAVDARWVVREAVAGNPSVSRKTLIDLSTDPHTPVREAVARNPHTPSAALGTMVRTDSSGTIRMTAARHPSAPPDALAAFAEFARDHHPAWRAVVARHPSTPPETLVALSKDNDKSVYTAVARNPSTPPEVLAHLALSHEWTVRRATAENPSTPSEAVAVLAADPITMVRNACARREVVLDIISVFAATGQESVTEQDPVLAGLGPVSSAVLTEGKPEKGLAISSSVQQITVPKNVGHARHRATSSNTLAVLRPDLAAEWDQEANGDLTPEMVTIGSNKKIHWICKDEPSHRWITGPKNRTKPHGSGCPHCTKQRMRRSNTETVRQQKPKSDRKPPQATDAQDATTIDASPAPLVWHWAVTKRQWVAYGPTEAIYAAVTSGDPVDVADEVGNVRQSRIARSGSSFNIGDVEYCYGYLASPQPPLLMSATGGAIDVAVTTGLIDESLIDAANAAWSPDTKPNVLVSLALHKDHGIRWLLARNTSTPPEALRILAACTEWRVRMEAALHPNTPSDVRAALSIDQHEQVRIAALGNRSGGASVPAAHEMPPALSPRDREEDNFIVVITAPATSLENKPYGSDFIEVWQHYPLKVARKAAYWAYAARRHQGVPASELLMATRAYATKCAAERTEQRSIMSGATFFSPNEQWLDYLQRPARKPAPEPAPDVPPSTDSDEHTPWAHLRISAITGTPGEHYLARQGIPPAACVNTDVQWCAAFGPAGRRGRPAIVFLIRDGHGATVAVHGRFLSDMPFKAMSLGPVSRGLFVSPGADETEVWVVCESPLDALALKAVGVPALATCGARSSWPTGFAERLGGKTLICAQKDNDAGDKQAVTLGQAATRMGANVVRVRLSAENWRHVIKQHGWATTHEIFMAATADAMTRRDNRQPHGASVIATPSPMTNQHSDDQSTPSPTYQQPLPGVTDTTEVCTDDVEIPASLPVAWDALAAWDAFMSDIEHPLVQAFWGSTIIEADDDVLTAVFPDKDGLNRAKDVRRDAEIAMSTLLGRSLDLYLAVDDNAAEATALEEQPEPNQMQDDGLVAVMPPDTHGEDNGDAPDDKVLHNAADQVTRPETFLPDNPATRAALARRPSTHTSILRILAEDTDASVRAAAASHHRTPSTTLALLAEDTDASVRAAASANPNNPSIDKHSLPREVLVPDDIAVAMNNQTIKVQPAIAPPKPQKSSNNRFRPWRRRKARARS